MTHRHRRATPIPKAGYAANAIEGGRRATRDVFRTLQGRHRGRIRPAPSAGGRHPKVKHRIRGRRQVVCRHQPRKKSQVTYGREVRQIPSIMTPSITTPSITTQPIMARSFTTPFLTASPSGHSHRDVVHRDAVCGHRALYCRCPPSIRPSSHLRLRPYYAWYSSHWIVPVARTSFTAHRRPISSSHFHSFHICRKIRLRFGGMSGIPSLCPTVLQSPGLGDLAAARSGSL